MMINGIRLAIAEFLNTIILDNKFIFFNIWHLVHFSSGIIIMFFLFKFYKKTKIKLLVLGLLLILYEIFEWSTRIGGLKLFMVESKLDILLDLIIGFFGGALVLYFKRKKK